MIKWPEGHDHNRENEEVIDDLYTAHIWGQIVDFAANHLNHNGFSVYYPAHIKLNDEDGTQYITDEWEGIK